MLLRLQAVRAHVGLGANLGDPRQAVADALRALTTLPGCELVRHSRLYRSAPVQARGPDFINAVAALDTRLTAPDLLAGLLQIEQAAGRQRPWRNAPRTLDLDLLLYGQGRMHSPGLVLPHPRMNARAFVLLPLAEIAPDRVPADLLRAVADQDCQPLPYDMGRA